MAKYRVDIEARIDVEANSEDEAKKKAISQINEEFCIAWELE